VCNQRFIIFRFANVRFEERGRSAALLDHLYRFPATFVVDVGNDDAGALMGHEHGAGPPDAGGGAGD
jgi:hypothetical protein